MTKLELLNVFLNERLTAAAEEIFRAVKDTMVEYQSEIIRSKEENERLKRLLNIAVQRLLLHPEPNSIQPQEAAPSSELQHCDQDWAISLSQEEPEPPPRIKEEPLEHRNTENEEQRPPSEFDTKGLTSPSYSDVVCSDVDQPPQRLLVPSLQPNGDSNSLPAVPSKDIKVENDREELITCQRSSVSPPLRIYSNFAGALCDSRGDASEANRATPRREKAPGREASLSKGPPPNGANGKPSAAHVLRVKNAKPLPSRHSPHPAQGMQKWHSCRECGKCFSFACQLEVHTRWHTKEKPYSCAVCRKSFTTVSMLKRHHRIHTGEKPFRCHVCGKCFNQSAHLNTHFRLHTGERARWARVAHPAK